MAQLPQLLQTQNLKWTLEKANTAYDKLYFISVPRGTTLKLGGATRMWQTNPGIVYAIGYRIAGTPLAIREALQLGGVDTQTINEILATAISVNNYQGEMKQLYDQELADLTRRIKEKAPILARERRMRQYGGFDWQIAAINRSINHIYHELGEETRKHREYDEQKRRGVKGIREPAIGLRSALLQVIKRYKKLIRDIRREKFELGIELGLVGPAQEEEEEREEEDEEEQDE